ncbi:endonuclease/exonuclease/phosphatase family protein [Kocuria rosea]|uniref:Endonuclease/exonuclease/phosphatase n=1 Tax=Kocuria rosea TaxID=1275 RepID=A0A4R5YII0_KOCRO|nr:endonuclease/exonuclease/phosphatase family protein [Kocuria rosea]TDL44746.1 endonuclease/exonuclease/phosphatase [Kocuria rosea]
MMKKLMAVGSAAALLVTAGALGASPAAAAPGHGPDRSTDLRVMSFNIHHGADGDDVLDLERTAAVIEASGAEVIGLQEVDDAWSSRSDFEDQAARLAEVLDMHYVYGANLDAAPAEGRTENSRYGNAILSEHPIIDSENHLLTSIEYAEQPTEQRGLLEAVINVKGHHVGFYSTHLDHQRAEQRELQAREILQITGESSRPAVVVGDLNAEPDAPELQGLFGVFTDVFAALGQDDAYTFAPDGAPVEDAGLRIDYVLVSEDVRPRAAHVVRTSASDHLPIVADLAIPRSPNGLVR